jgi:polyribonucleotide nucleotidyltransferase
LVLETGAYAFQANRSVKVTYGDTVVMVMATSAGLNPDVDYFPLSVNYEEKLYASGSIKTSRFMKRDGRPTDDAVITRRLIDHAIRPLFPKDFMDDVQVVATVMSLDDTADVVFAALVGVSAALHSSDIPWAGPMTSARVAYINDEYALNPTRSDLHELSELDMMVSFTGTGKDIKFLAVETEANILPDEKVLGAIEFAYRRVEDLAVFIDDFAKDAFTASKVP